MGSALADAAPWGCSILQANETSEMKQSVVITGKVVLASVVNTPPSCGYR
jgi:hypothetical protein